MSETSWPWNLEAWVAQYDTGMSVSYPPQRAPVAEVAQKMSTGALLLFMSKATIELTQRAHARGHVWEEARAAACDVLGDRVDSALRAESTKDEWR